MQKEILPSPPWESPFRRPEKITRNLSHPSRVAAHFATRFVGLTGALLLGALLLPTPFLPAQTTAERFQGWLPQMTASDLSNPAQVAEMEAAQVGWMNLCLQEATQPGNEAMRREVNQLMCDALQSDAADYSKAWLLHILAWTGTAAEVPAIAESLNSESIWLVDEAARALALIPDDAALNALQTALSQLPPEKASFVQNAIDSRHENIDVGTETDPPMALIAASDAEVAQWMEKFHELTTDDQARTLSVLVLRQNAPYQELAVECLQNPQPEIANEAALLLEKIGTPNEVPALLQFTYSTNRDLGIRVLSHLTSQGVDQAILQAFQQAQDESQRTAMAKVMSQRQMKSAVADILQKAQADDCPDRLAYLNAAESLSDLSNLDDFLAVLYLIPKGEPRDRTEQILARLCNGDAAPIMSKINSDTVTFLYPILGRIGDPKALTLLERGLRSRANSVIVASIRGYCNWPNAVVAERLLELSNDKKIPERYRIQLLRAFARVISLPDDQIGIEISLEKKVEMLQIAMNQAKRLEDRQLILDRASSVRHPQTITFALAYLNEEGLSENACRTIVELAHHDYLRQENRELFLDALDKVLHKTTDQGLKDRAQNYRNAIHP